MVAGAAVGLAGMLYQARPASACDSLSTSEAAKSHSGWNTPGSIDAFAVSLIASPLASK